MSAVDVPGVLAGLKEFQRDAVDHVFARFYGSEAGSGRFLVADETGLGKSIVARGVIARAIEHLEHVDDVDRIDVVYVCSNQDLARQNLRRLNVTGDDSVTTATRLSLLALSSARLEEPPAGADKKVNLVSFTPGTTFDPGGRRLGSARERALLTLILDQLVNTTKSHRRSTRLLLQGGVGTLDNFSDNYVRPMAARLTEGLDPRIVNTFEQQLTASGLLETFIALRDAVQGFRKLPRVIYEAASDFIGEARGFLAQASIESLEPDLVILDEFQRFKHLLDLESGGPAAELAHALFDSKHAKVLLLSATPYKPFTNAADSENHYEDFLNTIKFLATDSPPVVHEVKSGLANYRHALVSGATIDEVQDAADHVSEVLIPLMTRSERPVLNGNEDLVRVLHPEVAVPTPADFEEWASLQNLGTTIGSSISLEYWKSVPYFVNFMDGYKPGTATVRGLQNDAVGPVAAALGKVRSLDPDAIRDFEPIDLGNGYLRSLAQETVGKGWWKLLWLPATLPYLTPGPVYSSVHDQSITKHVIFSAWTATPTSVSALLSYEADRHIAGDKSRLKENTPEARAAIGGRLRFTVGTDDHPEAMSALALFWPHPVLAQLADPLAAVRKAGAQLNVADLTDSVSRNLDPFLTDVESVTQAHEAYFSWPGLFGADPAGPSIDELVASLDDAEQSDSLKAHVGAALAAESEYRSHPALIQLAAHGPGNIAWRALNSISGPNVTAGARRDASLILSFALRSIFNRPDTDALLHTLYGEAPAYWRQVLNYCADGNLQAVLDEYMFQLKGETGGKELEDADLISIAQRASDALRLKQVPYLGHAADAARTPISFPARFAVRYGGRLAAQDDKSGNRQHAVREAFNSPFAPFVLVSTSVGQEGIDFHWWSHSVIHWNLPGNPVDFEQREGRINRFAGHAIRKNIAESHWSDVLGSTDPCIWTAAFGAADQASLQDPQYGDFAPWWIYPGSTRIHRNIMTYPLSLDAQRYERLRSDLTHYRLTLGQPRQEDMVTLLRQRGMAESPTPTINLSPPKRPQHPNPPAPQHPKHPNPPAEM